MLFCDKLECLNLANIFTFVHCRDICLGAYPARWSIFGAPFGYANTLITKIRHGDFRIIVGVGSLPTLQILDQASYALWLNAPGTLFTTLHFLRNLRMGRISWGVCPCMPFRPSLMSFSKICKEPT